jgi:NTP pyrophosphatase (non-canonical NTP hydrolase)
MHLSELTARAMEIRQRFAAVERARGGGEWTPAQLMQGFVVDVGDLMRLAMAKDGARHVPDLDAKLGHELADCLWSVLVLAKIHGVDLEREFVRTMDQLDAKLAAG